MRKRLVKVMAGSMLAASLGFVGAGTASAGGGGCFHETPPSESEGTTVDMIDSCFQATVLRVEPGTDVTWVNRDTVPHTVTGVGGTWGNFDELAFEERTAYSFENDGVYLYSCLVHPGMVGAVVVGDGRGDGGLEPAAVTALPGSPGGGSATQASTSSTGLSSGIVGGAVGIVLGLGIACVLIARRRTPRVA